MWIIDQFNNILEYNIIDLLSLRDIDQNNKTIFFSHWRHRVGIERRGKME